VDESSILALPPGDLAGQQLHIILINKVCLLETEANKIGGKWAKPLILRA
jgi:hypothetical protein